jgi:hypothetical protein
MTRIGDRAVAVMPIVDKISFASRSQVPMDLQMNSKSQKGKAVDGEFVLYRRAVSDLKTSYKTEKGFLKMSILTGKILDWSA